MSKRLTSFWIMFGIIVSLILKRLQNFDNFKHFFFVLVSDMILTSVTDLITPNCESPMSYYRNFYTGEIFEYEGESHGYRALVVAMTPAGLTFTSYISGGGRYIICEEEGELESKDMIKNQTIKMELI